MNYSRETEKFTDSRSKRQQILDAAYEIFSHKGYHQATVDEIITLADTGKGTVYNYFVNKEQLFYTLVKERTAPFEVELAKIIESPLDPLAKVERIIKSFLGFYVINADIYRVLMHEIRGLGSDSYSRVPQEQREKYRQLLDGTIGMIEKVIIEGVEAGVIRQCNEKKAAHALFSVIVMMAFKKWVDEDIDGTAHVVADHFLYGIAKR
ncbi:MAG: TetR/AcrR family transcriptional regulator [Veillonellales bacterium]